MCFLTYIDIGETNTTAALKHISAIIQLSFGFFQLTSKRTDDKKTFFLLLRVCFNWISNFYWISIWQIIAGQLQVSQFILKMKEINGNHILKRNSEERLYDISWGRFRNLFSRTFILVIIFLFTKSNDSHIQLTIPLIIHERPLPCLIPSQALSIYVSASWKWASCFPTWGGFSKTMTSSNI